MENKISATTSALVICILLSTTSCTRLKEQDVVRFVLIADPQMGFSDKHADYSNTDFDYFRLTINKINTLSSSTNSTSTDVPSTNSTQTKNPAAEFALILGDMVHKQSDEVFQWPDYHGALSELTLPYHEVMGNHDGWSAKGLHRWRETWDKQDVYSFTHRGVFFMGLNSYFLKKPSDAPIEAAAQKRFITRELDNHAANPHKFIFQHFPLYINSFDEAEDGNKNLPLAGRDFMLDKIEKYKVKAVFNGHTHYEIKHDYKGTLLLSANPSSKTLGRGKRGFYTVDYNKVTQVISYRFIENTQAELDAFLLRELPI